MSTSEDTLNRLVGSQYNGWGSQCIGRIACVGHGHSMSAMGDIMSDTSE